MSRQPAALDVSRSGRPLLQGHDLDPSRIIAREMSSWCCSSEVIEMYLFRDGGRDPEDVAVTFAYSRDASLTRTVGLRDEHGRGQFHRALLKGEHFISFTRVVTARQQTATSSKFHRPFFQA